MKYFDFLEYCSLVEKGLETAEDDIRYYLDKIEKNDYYLLGDAARDEDEHLRKLVEKLESLRYEIQTRHFENILVLKEHKGKIYEMRNIAEIIYFREGKSLHSECVFRSLEKIIKSL